jgi:hypothetical protein
MNRGTHQRRKSRATRRAEFNTAKALFLLAGGHPDHFVPFNHNWRLLYAERTRALEAGDTFYSTPRKRYA